MVTEKRREQLKAACKRYYEKNKGRWRTVLLRFDKTNDADVIAKLESAPSKVDYIKQLIRKHG